MSTAWTIGFAVGVMIVAIACAVAARLVRRKGAARADYDERQVSARGKAFCAAYFTLLIYLGLWMILRTMALPFFRESLSVMLGALLSIGVFVGYSIFHDAYFKASERPRAWIAVICAVGLLNLVIGVVRLFRGETLSERLYDNASLFVGLLMLAVLACLVVKRTMDRRIGEE